jgi:hypothetical protein
MEFAPAGYFSMDFRCGALSLLEDRLGERAAELSFLSGTFRNRVQIGFPAMGNQCRLMVSFKLAGHANDHDSGYDDQKRPRRSLWSWMLAVFACSLPIQSKQVFYFHRRSEPGIRGWKQDVCDSNLRDSNDCNRLDLAQRNPNSPRVRRVLFGSLETYVLSWQIYHRPLGPIDFVHDQKNRDGLRGLSANFIRYYLSNFSFGVDGYANQSGLAKFLENKGRKILHYLHLKNVGYAFPHFFNDSTLDFTKKGDEYYSDYGLVGFAALLTSSVYVFWRPRLRSICWIVVASGFAALALNALIVGWMPWNSRFLCLSFVLFGVAMSAIVFGELRRGLWWRKLFGVMIIWSAFTLPFLCVDRRPIDLARAFYAREELVFDQRPEVRQIYHDVIALRKKENGRWFLIAGKNSYVLPFLSLEKEPWILAPRWEQISKFPDPGKDGQSFVLALNMAIPAGFHVEIVRQYADNTYILRLRRD